LAVYNKDTLPIEEEAAWSAATWWPWLTGIIGNLLLLGSHYDIALRDLGLLLAALALARLATAFQPTRDAAKA
jgi:hypothetical protein